MRTLFFSYWTKYFPNTLWYIIFPTTNKNVLKCLRWGSDVLKFSLNWGSAMFLRCSYFFQNLSLDVLINKVLKQSNACTLLSSWSSLVNVVVVIFLVDVVVVIASLSLLLFLLLFLLLCFSSSTSLLVFSFLVATLKEMVSVSLHYLPKWLISRKGLYL